ELRAFAPQWRLILWDLPEQDPAALLALPSPWMKSMAMVRSERADFEQLRDIVGRLLPDLEGVHEREGMRGDELERFVFSWLARRRPPSEKAQWEQQFRELVRDPRRLREVLEMAETAWLNAEEEAELKAQERARQAARQAAQQATLSATRSILVRVLTHHFGTIPQGIANRIETCEDNERLQQAIVEAPTLKSLDNLQL